jgi:hypothetical protein
MVGLLARPERFELPTYSSGGCRSIQLSYGRVFSSLHGAARAIQFRARAGSRTCKEGCSTEKVSDYQRSLRPPRSPRSPPRPPRPPPPPPPPPPRSGFGLASFTFTVRPPICDPFKAVMALSPSSAFAISTNPKPRDRPVSRSVKMLTRSTWPYASKARRNSSSLVLKSRFPTKMFFTRMPSNELFDCGPIVRAGGQLEAVVEIVRIWRTVKRGGKYSRLLFPGKLILIQDAALNWPDLLHYN